MQENETDAKAAEAECAFRQYMDTIDIPYLPVNDSPETVSRVLRSKIECRRPDFILLLYGLCAVPVDVKHKAKHQWFPQHYLIEHELIEEYMRFAEEFRWKVWLAISNGEIQYEKWHWLLTTDVPRMSVRNKKARGKQCYVVPKKECFESDTGSVAQLIVTLARGQIDDVLRGSR